MNVESIPLLLRILYISSMALLFVVTCSKGFGLMQEDPTLTNLIGLIVILLSFFLGVLAGVLLISPKKPEKLHIKCTGELTIKGREQGDYE